MGLVILRFSNRREDFRYLRKRCCIGEPMDHFSLDAPDLHLNSALDGSMKAHTGHR
jgi:hypothetical protein